MLDIKAARKKYQEKIRALKKEQRIQQANKFKAIRSNNRHSKLENSTEGLIRILGLELIQAQWKHTFYWNGVKILSYIVDFHVRDPKTKEEFFIEAKGDRTTYDWAVKRACWLAAGPGRLLVYSGHHSNPQLVETIIPVSI